ncbi:MAG: pyruvate synthase subunit beta [Candidatus Diapherotrites archaeon]|nr:pyruvate synthase subunit beta [Candidatus Diapherotrites archaeon]
MSEITKLNDPEKELIAPGHRSCAGCGAIIAIREMLRATGKNVVICEATGCMEVTTTPYPETSWKVPWIHVLFENAASVASGVREALDKKGRKDVTVIALGGDGGTVDIGFRAMSGAMERGHNILYICYDNEAYMNTGVQRSGATPFGASTTTSPAGKVSFGKSEWKKNVPMIAVAHGLKYVATASIAYPEDFQNKIKKALTFKGGKYIHVHAPCPVGWGFESSKTIKVAKAAVETGMWALYEVENGNFKLTMKPNRKPVKEYLTGQKRFKQLKDEQISEIQEHIDRTWKELEKLESSDVNLLSIL